MSPVGADLTANNTTLYDSYAILGYDGFKDLFDLLEDATQWDWTWQVSTELTYLANSLGMAETDVEVQITAESATSLRFDWHFDYHQMAADERLVVKFVGTSSYFCTSD